jgi:hypothetical protein
VGLGLWPSRVRYTPRRALLVLDAANFNVLATAALRAVRAPGVDPIEIAHAVDTVLARGIPEAQDDFRRLLQLLENGLAGLLLDGRPRPFTWLGPEGQDAALYKFRDSAIAARRAGYHSLRRLCLSAYYVGDSTWQGIGYPGPPQISVPT